MKLIAQRPCNFGGKRFFVGDEIPGELVVNPKAQSQLGVLAICNDGVMAVGEKANITPLKSTENQMQVEVPINTESGSQVLLVAPGSITEALRIMQMDVKDAEKEIENLEEENVLIILHACDSRKGVKNASEKKAMEMQNPEEEEPLDEENMEGQLDLTDMEESAGEA